VEAKHKSFSGGIIRISVLAGLVMGFAFAVHVIGQEVSTNPLLEDGGYSADYSGIPRLRWMGPGEPDTYEDYMKGRSSAPFQVEFRYGSASSPDGSRAVKALVLVNATLYPAIQERLTTYVSDLEQAGHLVEVFTTGGGTPQEMKTFIMGHTSDLDGCVLLGDHPAAWFEHSFWGDEQFPCDLYYMDRDGAWTDSDMDGLWDGHSAGTGDEGPEIFLGRIDASMMTGNEADITSAYLEKNHAYRTKSIPLANHALSYTEDDWAAFMDIRTDIKYAYPDFDDIPAPDTNRDDYVNNRVPSAAYDFIQLCCHSSSEAHYFTRGGQAWNYEIKAASPHAMFYNLFCCSTLRFTTTNYLGGSYIYDTSDTSVAVIGSTKTGSMLEFHAFYKPFGAFESFGEAFRRWFDYLAPYSEDEIAWHFGMTIAGDPFLTLQMPALLMKFPEGLPDGFLPPGPETLMTVRIEAGDENPVPGMEKLHYRFDPADPYSELVMTPVGGDIFEVLLPGTVPGDEPEFYFSAQGDGGTTIFSPQDAPASVYSFDVGLTELVMEDDFETEGGWSVVNTSVSDGAWERADPAGTDAQPEDDHTPSGTKCFVTGPAGGSIGSDDLDGGPTRLVSPWIDLTESDALLSFYLYFYHSDYGVQEPLVVEISTNGINWHKVAEVNHEPSWTLHTVKVSDHVTLPDSVQVRFVAEDNPNDDIVEALVDDFRVDSLLYDPSLWADAYSIPVSTGAVIDFSLDASIANGGRPYLLLGTLSGIEPGFALPGGATLPLNWDFFTDVIMLCLGSPICQNFLGNLDGTGFATAVLTTPASLDPLLIGEVAHFAYTLGSPFDFQSNPIGVTFEP
jgi:hypothetical protein